MSNSSYRILFPLLGLLVSVPAFSQKIKYTGSLETAIMHGSFESEAAITTTHGIRVDNWSVSAGTGIDFYRFRSLPLFIDVKKYIPLGEIQPFVQVTAGTNIAWPTRNQVVTHSWFSNWMPWTDTASFKNGFYSKAGLGMVFNPKKKIRFSGFAGWSHKVTGTRMFELVPNGATYILEPRTTIYHMNRLYMGFGIMF